MKNFTCCVGHLISQLMEKGVLCGSPFGGMGGLRTFSRRLWAALTETVLTSNSSEGF